MTISSTTRTAGPFTGNDVTTVFAFTFKVFVAADLLVVRRNTTTNVEETLTLTTDYTVSLNADQDANPGGSVTLLSSLATGYTMIITSAIDILQAVELTNGGGFYPSVINAALDRLTIIAQQLDSASDRSPVLPTSVTGVDMTLPVPVANKYLGWNSTATGLENRSTTESIEALLASTATTSDGAALIATKHGASTGTFTTGAEAITLDYLLDNGRVDVLNFIPEAQRAAVIDGTTTYDASSDLGSAIDAGVPLWFGSYTIRIDSTVTKTLAARLDWAGSGATIKAGAAMPHMFLFSSPSDDISISGKITLDGNSLGHQGIRINNTSGTYPNVDVEGLTAKNLLRLTDESQSNAGFYLVGGFERVWIRGSTFDNINRSTGTSVGAGTSTTGGVIIFPSGVYGAQQIVIGPNNLFRDISNSEAAGSSNNHDVDAISVQTYDDGVVRSGSLLVYGNRFENCKGRSVKGIADVCEAHSNTILRDGNGTRGIEQPKEIDFQGGHGKIHHNTCIYRVVTESATDYHPMVNTTGVFIVSPASTDSTHYYGDAAIHSNIIINEVAKTDGEIPIVARVSVPATQPTDIYGASVYDNQVLGGAVTDFITLDAFGASAGGLAYLKADDNFATEVTNSLCLASSAITDARIMARRNVNGVGTAAIADRGGSAFGGVVEGYGNHGYGSEARNLSTLANPGAILRNAYMGGDGTDGATLRVYDAGAVADDATTTITYTGYNANRALVLVWSELSTQACGMFCVAGTTIVDLLGGTAPDIVYGTSGTNPDTDVKLNIWAPDSTGFSIKNRLGSTRAFTFVVIA